MTIYYYKKSPKENKRFKSRRLVKISDYMYMRKIFNKIF